MTTTLKLSAAAVSALLAFAGAARAEGVKIVYDTRSPEATRAQVLDAARKVCANPVGSNFRDDYNSFQDCVTTTVHETLQKIQPAPANVVIAQATRN